MCTKYTFIFLFFVGFGCQSSIQDSTIKMLTIDLTQEKSEVYFAQLINPNVDIIPLDNYDELENLFFLRRYIKFVIIRMSFIFWILFMEDPFLSLMKMANSKDP
ncbi:hypothetical protein C8N25_113153 [Algoriphagus antarcticus]|uniref:Lipoprotein n=1 Tax=Algoriphagus antarcticus TaxID=238540 RepID=A0A3E0DQT7_9BACT|nr:hypothetical protein C8N25_113153 [Algoriphagus antarcticus]